MGITQFLSWAGDRGASAGLVLCRGLSLLSIGVGGRCRGVAIGVGGGLGAAVEQHNRCIWVNKLRFIGPKGARVVPIGAQIESRGAGGDADW